MRRAQRAFPSGRGAGPQDIQDGNAVLPPRNIDGFGHRLEPAIDFDADDVGERVAQTIVVERAAAVERGEAGAVVEPTPEEVAARQRELQQLARVERARLESFFDFCCFDHSFVDLRRRTRQDLEVTGNAYWEVLRNGRGENARLVYVPAHTVRLLALDQQPVEVEERVRVSPVALDTVTTRRRLRRYVQVQGVERVFFKAFGDPRTVSKSTGAVFPDATALLRARADDAPATELLHFAIHSPRSPYGVPRWVGTLLSVLGSRSAEEVNYLYFENPNRRRAQRGTGMECSPRERTLIAGREAGPERMETKMRGSRLATSRSRRSRSSCPAAGSARRPSRASNGSSRRT